MISVDEAVKIVIDSAPQAEPESISLEKCVGRILAETIYADRDFPPYDRVTMDGIAIDYASYNNGQRTFHTEHICAAGSPKYTLQDNTKCVEVMTGAILPRGVDTVIRYEDLRNDEDSFTIQSEIKPKVNVHRQGTDYPINTILLSIGHKIEPIDSNILATVGKSHVTVFSNPNIAIISTGDELVSIDNIPLPHQIRQSNNYMLQAALNKLQISCTLYHIKDVKEDIEAKLTSIFEMHDVIMLSGGVSKGKYDYVPEILEKLGVVKHFHRVAQRPGKPFWFGTKNQKTVFAFPGNPVSTLVCFYQYFIPWLQKFQQQTKRNKILVSLAKLVTFNPPLTYFAQAKLSYNAEGKCLAEVSHGNGSGDMVNPSTVDGFVILPPTKKEFEEGEVYEFIKY